MQKSQLLVVKWLLSFSALLVVNMAAAPGKAECVILLHGLSRTSGSMDAMSNALSGAGYKVLNIDYPSTQFPIQTLAPMAIAPAVDQCNQRTIHFVTHSMGAILVRQYLSEHQVAELGRAVMLGPPSQGSEVIDKLGHWPGFVWLNGSAGQQLGTGAESLPLSLNASIPLEVGIIAGDRTINFFLSMIIPGSDDGKVSIERTKLAGMSDHIVLHTTHPFMMKNKQVILQTLHFLKNGHFLRTPEKTTE